MKKIILILILSSSISLKSQDLHFSQLLKSSFLTNPSLTSFQENDYKTIFQRRSQWESIADPFNTLLISIERKNFFPSHSIGLQFVNDVAGEAKFKTLGFNLTYSKLLKITKINLLSISLGTGIFQRSLFFDELIFSEEEVYENIIFWFPEVNLGFSNKYLINKKNILVSGISFFHLNRAKQSLIGDDKIRLYRKTNIHSTVYHSMNQKVRISPSIFYSVQNKEKESLFSLEGQYFINRDKKVILKSAVSYRNKDAIIYSFGAEIDNFDCLISYDFNTSSLSAASDNKGGFEFSIVYAWDIKQKEDILEIKNCPKYL